MFKTDPSTALTRRAKLLALTVALLGISQQDLAQTLKADMAT